MTRMTGPDCAVMYNLINTHTHTRAVMCKLINTHTHTLFFVLKREFEFYRYIFRMVFV